MYDPLTTLNFHYQRHRELMAEAQRVQLAAIARAGHKPAKLFYYDILAALGRRLCSWGGHLQDRYSPVELVAAGETSS